MRRTIVEDFTPRGPPVMTPPVDTTPLLPITPISSLPPLPVRENITLTFVEEPVPYVAPRPPPPAPVPMTLGVGVGDNEVASNFSPAMETYPSLGVSYFAAADQAGGDPATWSQYPATQDVDIANHMLLNVSQLNTGTIAADEVTTNNLNATDGQITQINSTTITVGAEIQAHTVTAITQLNATATNIDGPVTITGTGVDIQADTQMTGSVTINSPLIQITSPVLIDINGIPRINPQAPATGGQIYFQDALGNHNLEANDGNLYYDTELLAKAGDIQNVADWSTYPALQDVDMASYNLTAVGGIAMADAGVGLGAPPAPTGTITGVVGVAGAAGSTLTLSSNVDQIVLTADVSGRATFTLAPISSQEPTTQGQLTTKLYVDTGVGAAMSAAQNWAKYPATDNIDVSGYALTQVSGLSSISGAPLTLSVGTTTGLTLNPSGVVSFTTVPQSAVAPTTGNDLVNKTYVDGAAGGAAANWSTFPAISTVDCSGQDILNAGNLTANGATFAGVLKVDDQNIEMLGSGNYLEVGENSIRVLAPTVGYNDVYFEANFQVGDPGALTGPDISLWPNTFTMGDALHPISGGIYMTAGSLIQFTSPLINMLGANIAVGAGAVEIGAGNLTVGSAATAGGGANFYGGKVYVAPSAIGPPSGGNGGIVVDGVADIQVNSINNGNLGYLQIQEQTGSLTTNVVSVNNITQLTSAPSSAGMDITNVKTLTGNNLAITNAASVNALSFNIDPSIGSLTAYSGCPTLTSGDAIYLQAKGTVYVQDLSSGTNPGALNAGTLEATTTVNTPQVNLPSNPAALNSANGFTTVTSTAGDCVIQATGTVRVEDITGGTPVDGSLYGSELEANTQVTSPLYHIKGPTTASYLQSTVDEQVDITDSAGTYYDLKARDITANSLTTTVPLISMTQAQVAVPATTANMSTGPQLLGTTASGNYSIGGHHVTTNGIISSIKITVPNVYTYVDTGNWYWTAEVSGSTSSAIETWTVVIVKYAPTVSTQTGVVGP